MHFLKGRNPKVPWATVVWNSCILPKHAFTLWLGALGKLLTRDRLPFAVNKGCVLCHSVEESIRHLFFDCSLVEDCGTGFELGSISGSQ